MEKNDSKRFGACLTACAEIYGKPVSDAVFTLWWDILKGYPIEAVEAGFHRHMTSPDTGQYMPKPADVVRMIEGTSIDAAMLAWTQVEQAFRGNPGVYSSVTFDNPITMRVLHEMGGWTGWATKTEDDWPFIGNEFRARYKGYKSRGDIPPFPSVIRGLTEMENAAKGYLLAEHRPHVFIGNAEQARLVYEKGTDKPLLEVTNVVDLAKRLTVDR